MGLFLTNFCRQRFFAARLSIIQNIYHLQMITLLQITLCAAVAACKVLALEPQLAEAATTPFVTLNYEQSLPPLSFEPFTNGVRLRFNGNSNQKFSIERAPAPT